MWAMKEFPNFGQRNTGNEEKSKWNTGKENHFSKWACVITKSILTAKIKILLNHFTVQPDNKIPPNQTDGTGNRSNLLIKDNSIDAVHIANAIFLKIYFPFCSPVYLSITALNLSTLFNWIHI